MKKLIPLLFLITISFLTEAQTINRIPLSTTNHTSIDTVTNTGTRNQLIKIGNCSSLRIQANAIKISGTAGGNITIQGSQDGINFEAIPSYKSDGTIGMDTLKVTNVSTIQAHSFIIPVAYHNYYQISYTGVSTMAVGLNSLETEVISPIYFKQ